MVTVMMRLRGTERIQASVMARILVMRVFDDHDAAHDNGGINIAVVVVVGGADHDEPSIGS